MTRANPPSTPLATSKTAALMRVLDSVPKGYTHYTSGECPQDKLPKLLLKFHDRYGIGCSPAQRISRKKQGLANALLVLYQPPLPSPDQELDWATEVAPPEVSDQVPARGAESAPDQVSDQVNHEGLPASPEQQVAVPSSLPKISWLLLVTEGAGAVHEQEQLRSVLEKPRLHWLGYELRRHTARGRTSWTWYRPKDQMQDWYALLGAKLNLRDMASVSKILTLISQQPGFAGVREQGFALYQFARQKGYTGELPTLFFVQKHSHGKRILI